MGILAVIFSFVLLGAILVFGFASSIHKRKITYRERKDALDRENAAANPAGNAKTIQRLEQRVRVLERLATDRGQDLAAQIEELRGPEEADLSQIEQREKI